ncbi:hypothetical protein D0C36_11345 [Mucilaginibacter conchicola]|uniref:Hint domain-containing protein n=1 Tax=Mucilaginibacter conchicola TaxID=2303333 RepID=A0A372NS12_9SPHI|nr:hypothetical protein [Mucilaginibacter conchicola]RFZ92035.1 hypothetical protein D0C36_11345 [Mucilaginibacter conchicola]
MSFAFGTRITTPEGVKLIQEFNIGDNAMAYTAGGEMPKKVIFSSGAGPLAHSVMMYLRFDEKDLIVTPDQLFKLPDSTIKRADRLATGDQLLTADNGSATLQSVVQGMFDGGVHTIAIDNMERDGEHLIIANGIVCGDYFMEMNGWNEG